MLEPRNNFLNKSLFLYFFVVASGLIVDIGLLYLLNAKLNLNYLLASGISFSSAVISNYVLASLFVFSHKLSHRKLTLFFMVSLSTLLLNQTLMYLYVDIAHITVMFSKFLTLPFTFLWNYICSKKIVFK